MQNNAEKRRRGGGGDPQGNKAFAFDHAINEVRLAVLCPTDCRNAIHANETRSAIYEENDLYKQKVSFVKIFHIDSTINLHEN